MEPARAATDSDIPDLVELARSFRSELRDTRGGALWEESQAASEPLDDYFRTLLLASHDAAVVVGTIDGSTVGYGTVEIQTLRNGWKIGVIAELFVVEEARAVGVGESIAEHLVAFCVDAGCQGIDAFALPGNRATKNFFERSGFVARMLIMHKGLIAPKEL